MCWCWTWAAPTQVFGPVEIKGYTLNGFAILVHLDDPLVEQGLEVEAAKSMA